MLKIVVRLASVLVLILLLFITDAQQKSLESSFPLGSDTSISMDFSQTSKPKPELIAGMKKVVGEHRALLAKVVADPNDFVHGRSLYVFSGQDRIERSAIDWYDSSLHGELRDAGELGEATLDGPYVLRDGSGGDTLAQLLQWSDEHGVKCSVTSGGALKVFSQTLFSAGYGVAVFSGVVLMLMATMAWSASRARSKTLRILEGQTSARIQVAEVREFIRSIWLPLAATYLISLVAVAGYRGPSKVARYITTSGPFVLGLLVAMAICLVLISVIAWPSVKSIAERQPAVAGYRGASELLKFAALILTAISLPALLSSTLTAFGATTDASYWTVMNKHVSVRLASTLDENEFQKVKKSLSRIVETEEANSAAWLTYSIPAATAGVDSYGLFDGLVLVNDAYLHGVSRELGLNFTSTTLDSLSVGARTYLEDNYEIWSDQPGNLGNLANFFTLADGNAKKFPAIGADGSGKLETFEHPLIVSVANVSAAYNESFIGSVLSSSNLVFADSASLLREIHAEHLDPVVLSVDRIADVGLYQGQSTAERAASQVMSIILILVALCIGTGLAAYIYSLSRSRRQFPSRTAGNRWTSILGTRIGVEFSLALLCAAGIYVILESRSTDLSWAALLAPGLYACISLPAHVLTAQTVFKMTVARKV